MDCWRPSISVRRGRLSTGYTHETELGSQFLYWPYGRTSKQDWKWLHSLCTSASPSSGLRTVGLPLPVSEWYGKDFFLFLHEPPGIGLLEAYWLRDFHGHAGEDFNRQSSCSGWPSKGLWVSQDRDSTPGILELDLGGLTSLLDSPGHPDLKLASSLDISGPSQSRLRAEAALLFWIRLGPMVRAHHAKPAGKPWVT
jgi:hypothetical protein